MNLEASGQGLADDQVDAMQMGLSRMEESDAAVVVTDDFVGTIRDLTSQEAYSTDRGVSVVGARTLALGDRSVIVVNRPEASHLSPREAYLEHRNMRLAS